ncbi:AAA family ATPase [Campylobacter lanienae]|uniref:AAA family ATPase n=1 Tax=Campylobacter lanienae TaxID=75658 RepID=UPI0015D9080D|nr:AAA family ATPase [Campylobacter lanienae]
MKMEYNSTQSVEQNIHDIISKFGLEATSEMINNTKDEWIIPNFLTPQTITMIYASAGAGKSLFTLYLTKFLLQENKFSQIHYLDADNSPRVLKDRNLNQILDSFKDSFHYYFIDKPKNGDILTNLSKSNDLDGVLIIIDSIRNFINVDFTKDDKITSFLDKLQKLRNLGATIIFLHHQPKQIDDENNKTYKGSTAFMDSVDEGYYLSLIKEHSILGLNELFFTLEPQKFRFDMAISNFIINTDNFGFKKDDNLLFASNDIARYTAEYVIKILQKHANGLPKSKLIKELKDLAFRDDVEVYRKNSLWRFMDKFKNRLWTITREAKHNTIRYKLINSQL